MNERLYRSRDDRMIAGVAGGMSRRFNLDPSLVRVAWVVLVPLTGGIAVLAYFALAIIVPEEPYGGPAPEAAVAPEGFATPEGPSATGAVPGWTTTAPAKKPAPPRTPPARTGRPGDNTGALVFGGLLVLVGAYFLARQFIPGLDLDRLWPIVLIALGGLLILAAFRPRRGPG